VAKRFDTIDPAIKANPSPNCSSRHGREVGGIVIHYSAGPSAAVDARWMCMEDSRVSSHFLISRQGQVTQLVRLEDAAWHCEPAEILIDGECRGDVNARTIGIELSNLGLLYTDRAGDCWWAAGRTMVRYGGPDPVWATLRWDNGHEVEGHWEPYPGAQIDGLAWLLERLPSIPLVGHEEIAMPIGRKMDPGGVFPWDRFDRVVPRRTSSR
jgi:N-acetylmuramoyl-L-alanine amidase